MRKIALNTESIICVLERSELTSQSLTSGSKCRRQGTRRQKAEAMMQKFSLSTESMSCVSFKTEIGLDVA